MSSTMEKKLRERARARSKGRCAYCDVHVGREVDIDFHRPLSCGGTRDADNAIWCCRYCNVYKGPYWHESDPPYVRLLHPLREPMPDHVRLRADGLLVGVTPEGCFYIERLHLNRPPLVEERRRMRESWARASGQ